ncbi:MAG: hypothetical protein QW087_05170 [Methanomassiliicoccales archaeon]
MKMVSEAAIILCHGALANVSTPSEPTCLAVQFRLHKEKKTHRLIDEGGIGRCYFSGEQLVIVSDEISTLWKGQKGKY